MAQARRKEKEAAAAQATAPGPGAPGEARPWVKPPGLSRRGWIVLGAFILLVNVPLLHALVRGQQTVTVTLPYSDDFSSPQTVEENYWSTGGDWRIVNGELLSPGVKNNPLWLKASLPQNVQVEFDARSESPQGDIKVEIFGDGLNHQSGYVIIHGGWNNKTSIIARLDEHGPSLQALQQQSRQRAQQLGVSSTNLVDTGVFRKETRMRVEAAPFPVEIGKTYRWRIERRGSLLRWYIDGQLFMELDDPFPLAGKGHDRFGFSSWEANLFFDNLRVTPL